MTMPEAINGELARFAYHDQAEHPAEYVVARLNTPLNGHRYGIFVAPTGEALAAPCPLYSSGDSPSEAQELAYRFANELPRPRMIYTGSGRSGVAKSTAKTWASKNQVRFNHAYSLEVAPHGDRFGVYAIPKDWGQLIH